MCYLRRLAVSGVTLVALAFLPSSGLTQAVTGSIQGRLVDDSGTVLPGAAVTAIAASAGSSRHAVTDERGIYVLGGLTPAKYQVFLTLAGFKPVRLEITVSPGQTIRRDVVLSAAGVVESATPEATSR